MRHYFFPRFKLGGVDDKDTVYQVAKASQIFAKVDQEYILLKFSNVLM